jgi:hypothetical protein
MNTTKQVLNFRESEPLKTVSINNHLKNEAMNKQQKVKIDQEYIFNNKILKHQDIVSKMEKIRNEFKLTKEFISDKCNFSKGHYSGITKFNIVLTDNSYNLYANFFNQLVKDKKEQSQQKIEFVDTSNLTAQLCIDFLKATGEYKISKLEITTNWVEL